VETTMAVFDCKLPDKLFVLDGFFDNSVIQAMYNEITFLENFWGQNFLKLDITVPHREDALFLTHKFVSDKSPFCNIIEDMDKVIKEIFDKECNIQLEGRGSPWMWNSGIGEYVPKHIDRSDYISGEKNWKAIVYFNTMEEGWGGETIFHLGDFEKIIVAPKMGRLALFKADIYHSTTCISRHALNKRIMLNYAYTSANGTA
jgi:hypothetical protein